MEQYTIYCTAEQTKEAYKLGAPVEEASDFDEDTTIIYSQPFYEIYGFLPTAEQMIGWLEEQGINIAICICADGTYYNFYHRGLMKYYKTHKEATLAAIDAALDYLSKNRR